MVEENKLKAHVSEILPFEQAHLAHQKIESGSTTGKIILKIE